MNLEKEIFKKSKVEFDKLVPFGFKKENNIYKYSEVFMDSTFRADITINEDGRITGKVIDLEIDDEYINIRVESENGSFVNKVRDKYSNILNRIKKECFMTNYFISDQSNRITNYIIDKYKREPEFLWEKYDDFGVFRKKESGKWFAIMMTLDRSKIDNGDGEIVIINVKVEPELRDSLLKKKGYYEAYHMNKKSWITIILDDTVSDNDIEELIDNSYSIIK